MQSDSTPNAATMVVRLRSISSAIVRRTTRCTGEFMTASDPLLVDFSRFGSHDLAQTGTCTKASTQLVSRLTHNTKKRSLAYSPAVSGERYTQRNVEAAMTVAPNSGMAVLRPMR